MIGRFLELKDCIKSETAIRKEIDNFPSDEAQGSMNQLAIHVYDLLVDHFGFKIPFASFFRCKKLNTAIGGAKNSDHIFGRAIDLDLDNSGHALTNQALFMHILQNMEFKELIWEYGDDKNPAWVHVSWDALNNKKEVLIAKKIDGKTVYQPYTAL